MSKHRDNATIVELGSSGVVILYVVVKRVVDEPLLGDCDAVVGVDRGMNFLAVATNQNDKTMFYDGR